jgi:hypothetical protein
MTTSALRVVPQHRREVDSEPAAELEDPVGWPDLERGDRVHLTM